MIKFEVIELKDQLNEQKVIFISGRQAKNRFKWTD